VEERFIYCEYWTPVESPSSCLTEANPVSSFAGLPRNGASRT
jgi:hypothetical protein